MKRLQILYGRLAGNDLVRHSTLLTAGMVVVHICNMVFQMTVSRILPGLEFALLTAFLALIGIISLPLNTLSSSFGYYCSLMAQEGREGDVARLVKKWLGLTGAAAGVLGILMAWFSGEISIFLHLDRPAPILIAGILLPAIFWYAVLLGAAQGLQLFGYSAAANISGALTKLVVGAGLVWLWHPSCGWAMLGHGAGMYISALVLIIALGSVLKAQQQSTSPLPSMRLYLFQSFFIQIGFAMLMNADVILVKHLAPDNTEFPYAATLGRIVVFLPMSIAMAMFPKVASAGDFSAQHRKYFFQSLAFTGLFVGATAVICMAVPGLILQILFGVEQASVSMIENARLMIIAMSACALLNVAIQLLLAQRRFKATLIPLILSAGYVAVSISYLSDPKEVALASMIANIAAFTSAFVSILITNRNPSRPAE